MQDHFDDGINRAAVEAFAVEGIRSGRLTVHQARQILGNSSRDEMDGFLKARGVLLSITLEDLDTDARTAIEFSK